MAKADLGPDMTEIPIKKMDSANAANNAKTFSKPRVGDDAVGLER